MPSTPQSPAVALISVNENTIFSVALGQGIVGATDSCFSVLRWSSLADATAFVAEMHPVSHHLPPSPPPLLPPWSSPCSSFSRTIVKASLTCFLASTPVPCSPFSTVILLKCQSHHVTCAQDPPPTPPMSEKNPKPHSDPQGSLRPQALPR